MANTTSTKKYSYAQFAADVISLLDGQKALTELPTASMRDKAVALANAQETKRQYNAAHPRKSSSNGPSGDTQSRAAEIATVLGSEPMTAAEINKALGTEYTALQVANACKYIPECKSCKVVRSTINGKGLKADKEYTAYTVG